MGALKRVGDGAGTPLKTMGRYTIQKSKKLIYCALYTQEYTLSHTKVVYTLNVFAAFLLVCFKSLKESTCETRKNAFYSKAPFFLEKIKV